jgi:hypothetical protein
MHVEATPSVPELVPELVPEPPEPPPEPPELLLPKREPLLDPVPPPSDDDDDDEPELPQAHAPTSRTSDTDPTTARRRASKVRSFMTFPPEVGRIRKAPKLNVYRARNPSRNQGPSFSLLMARRPAREHWPEDVDIQVGRDGVFVVFHGGTAAERDGVPEIMRETLTHVGSTARL